MPLLKVQTNADLIPARLPTVLGSLSATTAELLGKSESYVMVVLEANPHMLFAGTPEPLAYVQLKSIGLPEHATSELSRALCSVVGELLGVDAKRVYIEFFDAARHLWGWNGATF